MKVLSKFVICLFGFSFVLSSSSCNENPSPTADNPDSLSVKKMSTDSNSAMPVHTPKDSTEKMPNSLDSVKK